MSGYHDHYKFDGDLQTCVAPPVRNRNTWFDMLALGLLYGSVVAIAVYILG